VADIESGLESVGTRGGFVPSGEGKRGGAVSPAIRLLIAAVDNASLCG
jgi:hypothetical protein